MIAFGRISWAMVRPVSASAAVATANPSSLRRRASVSSADRSSSTIRMLLVGLVASGVSI